MSRKLEVNLREEMKELIEETAYEVLVQRCSKKIRCSCYSEKYNEPDSKCPKCTGLGWVFKFEKHKAFKQKVSAGQGSAIVFTEIGMLTNNYSTFFFEHNSSVEARDYIWEVAWKEGKPIKLVNLYIVESTTPQRGEDGTIQFKSVLAKKEVLDKDFRGMYIGKAWRDIK